MSIRAGEQAHLTHLRHGDILGEAEGTFDGYGGIEEDEIFDRWEACADGSPNNHDEVMKSCFELPDSMLNNKEGQPRKTYNGKVVSLIDFAGIKAEENPEKYIRNTERPLKWDWDLMESCKKEYEMLEDSDIPKPASGVMAYHSFCYRQAKKAGGICLEPSKSDPNQGFGRPRKKFC